MNAGQIDFQLAFPQRYALLEEPNKETTAEKLERLAAQCAEGRYVNVVLDECNKDIETLAQLLKRGHLKPHFHCVDLPYNHPVSDTEPKRHCSLLSWAIESELDNKVELIALLLMCGANADAPEGCMETQTPRERVRALLGDRHMAYLEKRFAYILNLMGEPSEDYPAKWALEYAAGEGYFYGVQCLIEGRTVTECAVALKHNEGRLEEAKHKVDMFSFVLNHPDEDRTWFEELRERVRILERIYEYLEPIANHAVSVVMGTHRRLGENSILSHLDTDLLSFIMRHV